MTATLRKTNVEGKAATMISRKEKERRGGGDERGDEKAAATSTSDEGRKNGGDATKDEGKGRVKRRQGIISWRVAVKKRLL